jgi:hypothetical protein
MASLAPPFNYYLAAQDARSAIASGAAHSPGVAADADEQRGVELGLVGRMEEMILIW